VNPDSVAVGVAVVGELTPCTVAVGVPVSGVSVAVVGEAVGVAAGGQWSVAPAGEEVVGVAVGVMVGVAVCTLAPGPPPKQPAVQTTNRTAAIAGLGDSCPSRNASSLIICAFSGALISVGRLLRALKQMEWRCTAPTALIETPTRLIHTSNNVTNASLQTNRS
jgi:hypothetical protein